MALYLDIFDAVTAAIPSSVISPDACLFGEENLQAEANPPRIVWVPTTDSYGVPQQRGSDRSELRALYTCQSGVDIHCWGEDTPGTLVLRDAMLRAIRSTLGPNLVPNGGHWLRAEVVHSGRVYVLSLQLMIPVTEAAPSTTGTGTATATSETHDGTFTTT